MVKRVLTRAGCREVVVLTKTLSKALVQILYVLPYLATFIVAFSYGGLIIFGRFMHDFTSPRWSFQETALMTFSKKVDISYMQQVRPVEALIFTVFFFAAVLVALANLFLAMVTSASDEAQKKTLAVALSESVLEKAGKKVLYGRYVEGFLAFAKYWADARHGPLAQIVPVSWTQSRERDTAICTPQGRLFFPSECLLIELSPIRVNTLLRAFHHEAISTLAHSSLLPYLLTEFAAFAKENPLRAARDLQVEIEAEAFIASEYADPECLDLQVHESSVFERRRVTVDGTSTERTAGVASQEAAEGAEAASGSSPAAIGGVSVSFDV